MLHRWKCLWRAHFAKRWWTPCSDHSLCCSKAEFYTRHRVIVNCLTAFLSAAGLRVANEVQTWSRTVVERWANQPHWRHSHAPTGAQSWAESTPGEERSLHQRDRKERQVRAADKRRRSCTSFRLRLPRSGPLSHRQPVGNAADFYTAKCALDNRLCRKQLVERSQVALLQEVGLQAAAEEGLKVVLQQ